jgi:hypothetical protein
VQLVNSGIRPSGVSLLVYTDGYMPTDRKTEIYSDHAVDGVYSVTINVIELHYQLCKAVDFAGATCSLSGGAVSGGDSGYHEGNDTNASAVNTTVSGGHSRRQLAAAAAAGGANDTAADLTYFASVKCSSADSASFKLLATAIKSHLVNDISIHGELCPGNFIYHHWEHQHVGEERSVRFRLTKHGGDGSIKVRHGASFDEAPLKLEPPYLHMGEDVEHAFVEFCNATDATCSNEHVYVMLVGGEHCMSYEIVAEEEPNNECVGMGHGTSSSLADALAEAAEVAPHHFVYASCSGSEWVDFKLTLSADDYHYNYLIEVEDLTAATGQPDPTALSLHMYDYEIPQNRKTDHKAMRAIDGMYALAINRHNFHEGTTYISMHCEGVGAASRRFRLVVYQIEEFLTLDREYHGEVSPAEWVYHSYTVPTDGQPHNFTFHLIKHTGDLDVVIRHGVVPLKLIPPYTHVGSSDYEADTMVCNSKPGEVVYLGMLGGAHAASYEIIASELPPGAHCEEPPHAAEVMATAAEIADEELVCGQFKLASCGPHQWYDYYLEVTPHMV